MKRRIIYKGGKTKGVVELALRQQLTAMKQSIKRPKIREQGDTTI